MDQFEQTDQIPQRRLYQDADDPEIVKNRKLALVTAET
jgi:hypothetical protein